MGGEGVCGGDAGEESKEVEFDGLGSMLEDN